MPKKLPNVKYFSLAGLREQDVAAFDGFRANLSSLRLASCTRLSGTGAEALINRFPGLTSLDLSEFTHLNDSTIANISSRLAGLESLRLHNCSQLSDSGVRAIADKLVNLKSLRLNTCFRISNTGVHAVAERLGQLTQLEVSGSYLITDPGIKTIADRLVNLTSLSVSWCRRVTNAGVRAIASQLVQLAHLDLYGCHQVTTAGIRVVASRLKRLISLKLSRCRRLTDEALVAIALGLKRLTHLVLSDCPRVTGAGVVALAYNLSELTYLDLSECYLVTNYGVQQVADRLPKLTHLDLEGCSLVNDAGVGAVAKNLAELRYLCLADCNTVSDDGVMEIAANLSRLAILDIANCHRVTDVGAKAIADRLTRLNYLRMAGCERITDAGARAIAGQLTRLSFLDLKDIPSLGVPNEIVGNCYNPLAIKSYYIRGEQEGRRQLNEAKLIVVGNEAVGKTSLVNYLVNNQSCVDSSKTEGVVIHDRINVARWDIGVDSTDDTQLRLNVWDFGGQEVLYETHKFFLTARSLYLVVLEARRENTGDAESVLHDWMRAIRNRGGEDAPVVVVNKAESPHDLLLDEVRLKKEYPAIRSFIRTSCKSKYAKPDGGKGIDELRRIIASTVRTDLSHVRDWFPTSYFQVKEVLGGLTRSESMLTTARYVQICLEWGVATESEQDALLALLDQIGIVVRHSDTTLLDPNWLTTAVYRLLTHSAVVQAGGEYAVENLGQLLAELKSAEKYPRRCWPYIADMMVQFNLSFALPAAGRYLVPLQLPRQEPELNWNEANSLQFRYDYDSLPLGVVPRFIVEMHRFLTSNRTAWVNGVVLAVDSCPVLVRADRARRRVCIFVNGPGGERRGALAVVRAAFARVHALQGDLRVAAMVPVKVPNKPDAAVEYDVLVASERQGVKTIAVLGAEKPFLVQKLLNGVGLEPLSVQTSRSFDRNDTLEPLGHQTQVVLEPGSAFSGIIAIGEFDMAKTGDDNSTHFNIDNSQSTNSQAGAKAIGSGAKALNKGELTQHMLLSQSTASEVAILLDELIALLHGATVPDTVRPKLEEATKNAEEAKVIATSPAPDKSTLGKTWDKVKGWISGALSVGLFTAEAAVKVEELYGKVGELIK